MSRNVKKLFDIEIDEVSVVDRPANQHGLITFSKSAGAGEGLMIHKEDSMPENEIFDADGTPVEVDELEHGDVVYDADGAEYVFVEDEEDDVEKGWAEFKAGAKAFGAKAKESGKVGWDYTKQNKKALGIGAGVGAGLGAGAGFAGGRMSKSLGDIVLDELSKAASDSDREAIIAKALDEVEIAKAAAAEAWAYAEQERDIRVTEEFISKAAEYNLPVAPEVFGPILKSLTETLDDEQLDILDEIFTAVGDALYNEVGYVGETSNASVLDTVSGLAAEMVGKSNLSYEQSVTAMFEANPSAYDAYLSEGR